MDNTTHALILVERKNLESILDSALTHEWNVKVVDETNFSQAQEITTEISTEYYSSSEWDNSGCEY